MFALALTCLVSVVFAVGIPRPKLKHLLSGDLSLAVEDVLGLQMLMVQYEFAGVKHKGTFEQGDDGVWYHNNWEASYNGRDKIKYSMVGEVDGQTVFSKGILTPEENGLSWVPPQRVCRGTVVFRDDFNGAFNPAGWDYEVSMYGGYNWEIQAYVPEARNVFTRNGHLFIKPTLTVDHPDFDEIKLHTGVMDMKAMYGYCTNSDRYGCHREGKYGLLPPIMSGKIKSKTTIRFGKVEVRARVPRGDWIWPAIWMLPRNSEYGGWPRSGEIDLMESRGNSLASDGSKNHGNNEVGATLHWGPDAGQNKFYLTHGHKDGNWAYSMHTYRLEWTVDHIQVFVDNQPMMDIPIHQSFWQKGHFSGSNIWASGTKAAPFDKDFYLILNVAVGGTNGFFPDNWRYNSPKPWKNNSPTENQDFWSAKNSWLPSWQGDAVAMEIDYVEMTQY